jgi:hypothetical protein
MQKLLGIGALAVAALLAGCGGGDGDTPQLVSKDATVAVNASTSAAFTQKAFNFSSGVAEMGTTAPTTVTFTSNSTTPAFAIASGGNTATGTTTFGSCHFHVTDSTFPADSPLAAGKTVVVDPCGVTLDTSGVAANGVTATVSASLVLGTAASTNTSVTVNVDTSGQLTVNGTSVGTVVLTPVTGA